MKTVRGAVLTVALAALAAAPVRADWGWAWVNQCGGDNYATCMSGSIAYNDGAKSVTVIVTNLPDAWGDVFTGVGLFNLPFQAEDGHGKNAVDGIAETCTGPGEFDCPSNHINGPLGDNKYIYTAGVHGINDGFPIAGGLVGATQQFTFTFNTSLQAYATTIGVGIHAQGGPQDCSTKFGVVNGVAYNPAPAGGYTGCGGGNSVPEPGSLFLLGSGVVGMVFVAGRRRKNGELVDQDGNDVEI